MGAGFAKELAANYPEALSADEKTESGDVTKLGTYSKADSSTNVTIYNLYTQFNYGTDRSQIDMVALEASFVAMRDDLVSQGKEKDLILIPKIGSGLAGGIWYDIVRVIDSVTNQLNIMVVLNGN